MTVRTVIMAGVILAMITGCNSASSSVPATALPVVSTPAPSDAASSPADASVPACLLGANGADVQVGIGNPASSCAQWITALAGSGLVWAEIPQMTPPGSAGADGDVMQVACDLTDGSQEFFVEDSGMMLNGNDLCSQEEQNGWTPQDGPLGDQANAAQASVNAAAQAQADASASASLASQTASDDQTLNSDVSSMQGDIKTYAADLATAQADYQKVSGEPKCNADGTSDTDTYADATSVYADGTTVSADETTLTNDISTAQGDVTTLGGDITTRPGTGTYAADITAANKVIAKAQGDVNAGESATIQNQADGIQTAVDACPGG